MEGDFYTTYFELEGRHWWFVGRRAIFLELLNERMPMRGNLNVLDFGCGTGAFLEHLDRFGSVSAVDGDEDAVRFCHQRGRSDVRHVPSGAALPFADASFDLVTTLDVIEHIEDDVAALREIRRVMRDGARLLVAVPAFMLLWGDQDEISHHHRRYTAKTLRAALEDAGFVIEHLSYLNTILFPPVAFVRLLRRALRAPRSDRTDFTMGPAWADRLLARLFSAEARLVSRGGLPFGVSVLAFARPA